LSGDPGRVAGSCCELNPGRPASARTVCHGDAGRAPPCR
jgi:hypothetical protein